MHRPKLEASHSAVRALSVSASNRGCMWHVSALYRPCIGHRTGYSLHENARISGLASADFEGFLHTATSGGAPGFFYARCGRRSAMVVLAQSWRLCRALEDVAHRDRATRACLLRLMSHAWPRLMPCFDGEASEVLMHPLGTAFNVGDNHANHLSSGHALWGA